MLCIYCDKAAVGQDIYGQQYSALSGHYNLQDLQQLARTNIREIVAHLVSDFRSAAVPVQAIPAQKTQQRASNTLACSRGHQVLA